MLHGPQTNITFCGSMRIVLFISSNGTMGFTLLGRHVQTSVEHPGSCVSPAAVSPTAFQSVSLFPGSSHLLLSHDAACALAGIGNLNVVV